MKGYRHYGAWPAPGDISGRLSAIRPLPHTKGRRRWLWMCECGKLREAYVSHVRNRLTQSCGCILREIIVKHGETMQGKTAEYRAWSAMIARCEAANGPWFHRYGGRGIKVCARWRSDFSAFLADMGRRPSNGHSIDRIDNDGDYEPSNCRWATSAEQSRNTRRTIRIEFNGERMCLKDAATAAGLSYGAAISRSRNRERGERMFRPSSRRAPIVWRGQEMRLTVAAKLAGLSKSTVTSRLSMGWSIEDALNTPRGAYVSGQDWHDAH